jgi:NADH-quinone oxidoreductase subunit F
MTVWTERVLPLTEHVPSLETYLATGGGTGLAVARNGSPESVIASLAAAGLRGRGGAGFPAARKWASIRAAGCPTTYVVANAAEGEPGTFKDRHILRHNPYQVIEGIAIACLTVGAARAFIVIKRAYRREIGALRGALTEMREPLGIPPIQLVLGPDEYLLGEEKAAMEVIEDGRPLPRIFPPYQVGLFSRRNSRNPVLVTNVETLAHVPGILHCGPDWFRSGGTDESPGSTVFTLSGDIRRPGVHELPLGMPLRVLVDLVGGGVRPCRTVKAVVPGASAGVLTGRHLDTPLDFESWR